MPAQVLCTIDTLEALAASCACACTCALPACAVSPFVCLPLLPSSRPLLQAFFEFFQALPGQQRLVGYSVYGDTYYAGPGQCV